MFTTISSPIEICSTINVWHCLSQGHREYLLLDHTMLLENSNMLFDYLRRLSSFKREIMYHRCITAVTTLPL